MTPEMEVAVWFLCSGGLLGFVLGFLVRPEVSKLALQNEYVRGKADGWIEASVYRTSEEEPEFRADIKREIRRVK